MLIAAGVRSREGRPASVWSPSQAAGNVGLRLGDGDDLVVRVPVDMTAVLVFAYDFCPVVGAAPMSEEGSWTTQAHDLVSGSKGQQCPLLEGQPLHLDPHRGLSMR